MSGQGVPPEQIVSETSNGEIEYCPQDRLCRLQYMIAFLLEKNEQIRQELAAMRSSEQA
jgi:hypothetical protein